MRFDEDRRPPLWIERSELTWESDLTPRELAAEDLDERPSLVLLLGGRSSSSRAWNSTGADRLSRHRSTRPAVDPSHRPAAGPTFPGAA